MYIYLGRYYHKSGKELSDLTEKKIGLTKNLDNRERELNSTKFTVGYTFVKAWETGEDTNKIERSLHAILDDVRMDGEWFEDSDKTLISRMAKFMNSMGYPEVDLVGSTEDENRAIAASNSEIQLQSYNEIKNRLNKLGVLFEEKFNTNKNQPIVKFEIKDVKLAIGVYSSGTKFWMHTLKDSGEEYLKSDSRFTKTADGWRYGDKGELYATDINDLFLKLEIFISVINPERNSREKIN
jgi:hypothetical protein